MAVATPTTTTTAKPFRVFYSWQSDLPNSLNRGFIKGVLEKAAKEFQKKTGVEMIVDEATRDETGATHIPDAILRKIRKADYFVADLTPVAENAKRKLPNSNVCIEMGYALAELGWDRIGMVFNSAYGKFPVDLPFDAEKRRGFEYHIDQHALPNTKSETKGNLSGKLAADIVAVHAKNPAKARFITATTPETLRRTKDCRNLRRVLGIFPPNVVDATIETLSVTQLHYSIPGKVDAFRATVRSTGFIIHDKEVSESLKSFALHLSKMTHITAQYNDDIPGSKLWRIRLPEKAVKPYQEHLRGIEISYRTFIDLLAERFPEIDPESPEDEV